MGSPRLMYGIYSISPFNKQTGMFYAEDLVVDDGSFSIASELVKLQSGAQNFPWGVEEGYYESELSFKFGSLEAWMFTLFMGKAPTENTADTAGTVSGYANVKGSSLKHATTGVASVAVKAAVKADLKFAKYILVCTGAAEVDVYASTSIDLKRGTDKSFLTDANKIAAALTVTASTATEITGYGVEITGGSGTIGMTTGDTAEFYVKPPSSKSMEVVIGGANDTLPEFGCIMMGQQLSDGSMWEIEVYRCKGAGLPLGMSAKQFSKPEVKAQAFYDSVKGGVASIRNVTPS